MFDRRPFRQYLLSSFPAARHTVTCALKIP
jgi:hypothetical protein